MGMNDSNEIHVIIKRSDDSMYVGGDGTNEDEHWTRKASEAVHLSKGDVWLMVALLKLNGIDVVAGVDTWLEIQPQPHSKRSETFYCDTNRN